MEALYVLDELSLTNVQVAHSGNGSANVEILSGGLSHLSFKTILNHADVNRTMEQIGQVKDLDHS